MKVAVCGVWHVHATDYTKEALARGEVVGFFERDDALAAAFAEKHPVPRFGSFEELLASDAEGVIVCSATKDHKADIIRIARAGKHIFTEKVLALTDAEAAEIAAEVAKSGVFFTISLFQKYLGSRRAVYEVAKSGELGKINYLRFRNCHSGSVDDWLPRHFYNASECGGGAMIDLGAHGMYLTHWILGMPVSAKSVFTRACSGGGALQKNEDGVEDSAVTVMQFADGAIAINETGFVSRISPPVFEVCGEDGYVRMEGDSVVKCSRATEGRCVAVEVSASLPIPIVQFLEQKPLGGCSMEEALALTHMMELAYQNA